MAKITTKQQDRALPATPDRAVAASPSSPSVSPLRASIPSAMPVLIDNEEYQRRREVEIKSALRSREVFGSWAAYAQSILHGLVTFENDRGRQWGSLHHQMAIVAAGLQDELDAQGIVTATADETRRGSVERSEIEPGPEDAP